MAAFAALIHSERVNAGTGWVLTSIVAFAAAESFLTNAFLWGGLAVLVVLAIAAPAVVTRNWTMMIPWPLVLVLAVTMIVRAAGLDRETAGYIAIVALALIVVIELDVFTPVDMTRRFAVGFAVLTTMAIQGLWTVAQFYSDRWLDTAYLRSQTELQWDFVIVTVVAIVMGGIFEWYFQRSGHVSSPSNRQAKRSHHDA